MTEEERRNILTENLVTKHYLLKFGYLASLSTSYSSKNFKAKLIRDYLMFFRERSPKLKF